MSQLERTVTVSEAAAEAGVHPSTIHYWIKTGKIRANRRSDSGPWLVDLDSVIAYQQRLDELGGQKFTTPKHRK